MSKLLRKISNTHIFYTYFPLLYEKDELKFFWVIYFSNIRKNTDSAIIKAINVELIFSIIVKSVITDWASHTGGQNLSSEFVVGLWFKSYGSFVVTEWCPGSSQSR